jgi:arylsulfatase A-like enzyme
MPARRPRSAAAASASDRTRPNILLFAVDSLLADHMSCYGYPRLTTPHLDKFASQGTLFERTYSPHVPTTPAYASMLTGRDCFGTEVVALRHQGNLTKKATTLAEICRANGYNTTCVGFGWNPSSRGFDKYLEFSGWGSLAEGRSPKAQNLNDVAQPEIDRLNAEARSSGKPWFVMLRHMDPHSPYLPPVPFDRMFYHGNETDPANESMKPVWDFKPFRDYFATWMPPGCTDKDYIIAQYDGAIAYMDACIARIFTQLESLGILDNTIVVINGDHGETLYDHECWFDHHGMYDVTLHVPLIVRYPGKVPAGKRVAGYNQHKDLVPTLCELADLRTKATFDGRSLMQLVRGEVPSFESEFYITECTWMRKHGWRTPQWKLILALEPDFHFKPKVELYNLVEDPHEDHNVADENPDVVKALTTRMNNWIAKREKETGIKNPIHRQGDWHGHKGLGAFKSSKQAYDTLHIGDVGAAKRLQADKDKAAAKPPASAGGPNRYATKGQHHPGDETERALITVIGRGHGGTRAMSHTLSQSGVYMGDQINKSGDLLPPDKMYEACRVMAKYVTHKGGLQWDFSKLHTMKIDPAFTRLIEEYLQSVLTSPALRKGWKIPETTLVFPWIVRLFPDAHYINWVRDPRDSILGKHLTDDLSDFGIQYDKTDDERLRRAISWKYQVEIVRATPKPKRWMTVRFEDFVQKQDPTLATLEQFLGFPLVKIAVKPEAVGRYKTDTGVHDFPFLHEHLQSYGYIDQTLKGGKASPNGQPANSKGVRDVRRSRQGSRV